MKVFIGKKVISTVDAPIAIELNESDKANLLRLIADGNTVFAVWDEKFNSTEVDKWVKSFVVPEIEKMNGVENG